MEDIGRDKSRKKSRFHKRVLHTDERRDCWFDPIAEMAPNS